MKTNSFSRKNSQDKENIIWENLPSKTINKIARKCGYLQRRGGKISAQSLIIGFFLMISRQRNTYTSWASTVGLLEKKIISKQALNARMNMSTEQLIKEILEEKIKKKMYRVKTNKRSGLFKKFRNILIDDSTILLLPEVFIEQYPGCISRSGKKQAMAKIHAQYNLTENNFSFFHIHSYTNNDQSLSAYVLPHLHPNDLCIRDLGFMRLDVIEEFIKNNINFISRKNYHTFLYDPSTGGQIDLAGLLRKRKWIDTHVLIGKEKQLKVRLIAVPLSRQHASERIRKARADRDKRNNHSEEYYQLLGYNIFITNIPMETCTGEQIATLYKLRWQIETIFKCWKSCFSLEKMVNRQSNNVSRINCTILLMLLYIFLFQVVWWSYCEKQKCCKSNQPFSMLKLGNFFSQHFVEILFMQQKEILLMQIHKHCRYDKRNDRNNFKQKLLKMAA